MKNNKVIIGSTQVKAALSGIESFKKSFEGLEEAPCLKFGSAVHAILAGEDYDFGQIIPLGKSRPRNSTAFKEDEVFLINHLCDTVKRLGFVPDGEREKEYFVENIDDICIEIGEACVVCPNCNYEADMQILEE